MDRKKLQEFAHLVKESRIERKITQQELAEISGISLRSIQRIENAEVFPRAYTVKTLTDHLGISAGQAIPVKKAPRKELNRIQKRIVSFSVGVLLFLIACAYVFQSATFPESAFELFLYISAFVALYTLLLIAIWR